MYGDVFAEGPLTEVFGRSLLLHCPFQEVFVAGTSQLIQPLISTEAFSTLQTVVPGAEFNESSRQSCLLPSRAVGASRYRQALLTSIPLAFADLLAIAGAYLVATLVTYGLMEAPQYSNLWNNLLALCLCHLLLGSFNELFPASGMNPVRELRNQLTSIAAAFLVLVALNGLAGKVTRDEVLTIVMAFPMTFLAAPVSRFCTRKICAPFRWWGEKVIIVGSTQQGMLVYKFLKDHPQRGLKPLGIIDDHPSDYWRHHHDESVDFIGTTEDLVGICRKRHCHWVIAAIADKQDESAVRQILTQGSLIPNLVVLHSNLLMPTMWVESFDAAGLSGVHIRDRLLFPFQRLFKRGADIVLSVFLLVLCIPLYLGIIIWIRTKSDGPILYRHERIGRSGKPFGAWKFRTMVPDSSRVLEEYLASNPAAKEEWEQFHKLKTDPRVIPGIGEVLRRNSLDELPQLWNVLTALRLIPHDGGFLAIPGYPGLRLGGASLGLLGQRGPRVAEGHWKRRVVPAWASRPAPLRVLYLLARGPQVAIEKVESGRAIVALIGASLRPGDATENPAEDFEDAVAIARAVAVRRLRIPAQMEALAEAVAAVERDVASTAR